MFRFAALLSGVLLATVAFGSDVVVLTSENFEKETQATTGSTTGDWLLDFYAPWCGHCKKLAPTWEQIATSLKGKVNVAKIDVTENRDLGSRFGIKGFPTIKFLSKGEVYDYKGSRSADALTEFALGGFASGTGSRVPAQPSLTEEVTTVLKDLTSAFMRDIKRGDYFSRQVLIIVVPVVFFIFMIFSAVFLITEEPSEKVVGKKAD